MTVSHKISRGIAAASCGIAMFLAGCSSHDERFADTAPPRAATLADLRTSSSKLLTFGQENTLVLSPNALVGFTNAAVEQYRATSSPSSRRLVETFADALLDAQLKPGGTAGFSAGADPDRLSTLTSLRAGIALAGAYSVTDNERYAETVRGLADLAKTSKFGWRTDGDKGLIVLASRGGFGSIAQTALAACLFARAADVAGADTETQLTQAVAGVDDAQAAVGRWYADTSPDQRAMTLDQWATTLTALDCTGTKEGEGILGAGVPAMVAGTFRKSGDPLDLERDRIGLPLAIGTTALYPDVRQSGPIVRTALDHRRPDGTIDYAPADDLELQSAYAEAVAQALFAESVRKGVAKP
ncbi:MAG: hypothetical protein JHD16_03010 [Solirubrobacteraceae bacterium]|nr:hypothetical protein [Solirubrobacteraceae bacterium]